MIVVNVKKRCAGLDIVLMTSSNWCHNLNRFVKIHDIFKKTSDLIQGLPLHLSIKLQWDSIASSESTFHSLTLHLYVTDSDAAADPLAVVIEKISKSLIIADCLQSCKKGCPWRQNTTPIFKFNFTVKLQTKNQYWKQRVLRNCLDTGTRLEWSGT